MNLNFSSRYTAILTSERRVCTSVIILLDRFSVMWTKKPDICNNRGLAEFIERKHWPSITILSEGFAAMWSKKCVTLVNLNCRLVYILRLVPDSKKIWQ